jgi:hypothetical protein
METRRGEKEGADIMKSIRCEAPDKQADEHSIHAFSKVFIKKLS